MRLYLRQSKRMQVSHKLSYARHSLDWEHSVRVRRAGSQWTCLNSHQMQVIKKAAQPELPVISNSTLQGSDYSERK